MSDGEVKRWEIKATKWDNPKAEWRFHDSEGPGFPGYDSPPPCIKVMRVEDHERIVAELKAELDERTEQLETTMERYRAPARTIATQKRVIEKLKDVVTCVGCAVNESCPYVWDGYNTNGDCLAEK